MTFILILAFLALFNLVDGLGRTWAYASCGLRLKTADIGIGFRLKHWKPSWHSERVPVRIGLLPIGSHIEPDEESKQWLKTRPLSERLYPLLAGPQRVLFYGCLFAAIGLEVIALGHLTRRFETFVLISLAASLFAAGAIVCRATWLRWTALSVPIIVAVLSTLVLSGVVDVSIGGTGGDGSAGTLEAVGGTIAWLGALAFAFAMFDLLAPVPTTALTAMLFTLYERQSEQRQRFFAALTAGVWAGVMAAVIMLRFFPDA